MDGLLAGADRAPAPTTRSRPTRGAGARHLRAAGGGVRAGAAGVRRRRRAGRGDPRRHAALRLRLLAATDGLTRVALDHPVAVGFGVLTCDTEQQALDRAGSRGVQRGQGARGDRGRAGHRPDAPRDRLARALTAQRRARCADAASRASAGARARAPWSRRGRPPAAGLRLACVTSVAGDEAAGPGPGVSMTAPACSSSRYGPAPPCCVRQAQVLGQAADGRQPVAGLQRAAPRRARRPGTLLPDLRRYGGPCADGAVEARSCDGCPARHSSASSAYIIPSSHSPFRCSESCLVCCSRRMPEPLHQPPRRLVVGEALREDPAYAELLEADPQLLADRLGGVALAGVRRVEALADLGLGPGGLLAHLGLGPRVLDVELQVADHDAVLLDDEGAVELVGELRLPGLRVVRGARSSTGRPRSGCGRRTSAATSRCSAGRSESRSVVTGQSRSVMLRSRLILSGPRTGTRAALPTGQLG